MDYKLIAAAAASAIVGLAVGRVSVDTQEYYRQGAAASACSTAYYFTQEFGALLGDTEDDLEGCYEENFDIEMAKKANMDSRELRYLRRMNADGGHND